MSTQSLDLNKMGLAPMQSCEMQEVDGGLWSLNNIGAFTQVVIGSAGVILGALTAQPEIMVGGAMLAANGAKSIN